MIHEKKSSDVVEFLIEALKHHDRPFIRNHKKLDLTYLFSLESLEKYLCNPLLTSDWCQITLDGATLDLSAHSYWKNVQRKRLIFIDKKVINDAIEKGASVVLEGLDIFDSNINQLLASLDKQFPRVLSNCEAFFSQKNNEAYPGHTDSDDVLVLQIEGKKKWLVYEAQRRRYLNNSPLHGESLGPILAEFIMEPGDALFLRAGVPHKCVTEDNYSLHLSIDLIDRTLNIEQITNFANSLYNNATAQPHLPASEVAKFYKELLSSNEFLSKLNDQECILQSQILEFRKTISRAARIDSLGALGKNRSA